MLRSNIVDRLCFQTLHARSNSNYNELSNRGPVGVERFWACLRCAFNTRGRTYAVFGWESPIQAAQINNVPYSSKCNYIVCAVRVCFDYKRIMKKTTNVLNSKKNEKKSNKHLTDKCIIVILFPIVDKVE